MGTASRQAVAGFSWKPMVDGYLRMYDEATTRMAVPRGAENTVHG